MKTCIFKLSGKVFNQSQSSLLLCLEAMLDYSATRNLKPIFVHGGGQLIDQWLKKWQQSIFKIDGQRVTDQASMPIITGAIAGPIHQSLIAGLNTLEQNTISLSPSSLKLSSMQPKPNLGQVAELSPLSSELLVNLLEANFCPVFHCIASDKKANLYNVNADFVAILLANLLKTSHLFMLSDTSAVLDKYQKPIAAMNEEKLSKVANESWVHAGMKAKLDAILSLDHACQVSVGSGLNPTALIELLSQQAGTQISLVQDSKSLLTNTMNNNNLAEAI